MDMKEDNNLIDSLPSLSSSNSSLDYDKFTVEEEERIKRLEDQKTKLRENIKQLQVLQEAIKVQQQSKKSNSFKTKHISQQSPPSKTGDELGRSSLKNNFSLTLSGSVSFANDRYCIDLQAGEESLRSKYLGCDIERGPISTAKSGISSLTFDHAQFAKVTENKTKDQSYIDIVAPADLPEGFTFDVQLGPGRLKVRVPEGGVQKGDRFTNPIVIAQPVIHVPTGHWRDRLWNIYSNGVCHPFALLPFIAPLRKYY